MNEENKLTDEEIAKAIEKCFAVPMKCEDGCPYFNKHGRNFCIEDKAFYKDMKRIVQEHSEQKAEIERLTEVRNDFRQEVITLNNEKRELKKQVDELNERLKIDLEYEKNWGKIQTKQAVKDTAKEICKAIHEDLQADLFYLKHSIFDTERQKAQEQQNIGILSAQNTVSRFEKKIKERYGVSYEENN